LLAQAVDVDLDRIGRNVTRQPENVIFDQLLRDDAVLAAHQQFKHGRFAGGENLRLVIDECLPAFGIECEVGNLQCAPEQLAGASQERLQPRQQLLERERLDEIIIRTAAQAANAILQSAAGGEH
jgi:hypothetical protein